MNNEDSLYLVWKDPRSRRNYVVGKLTRGDKYTFEYCGEYKDAESVGWRRLESFPDDKVYESNTLFAGFSSRLPDPKRRGIDKILAKYHMTRYDGYELLKQSTGRLPIDTYEFIEPIYPDDAVIQREFFVAGVRHNAKCKGMHCDILPTAKLGDELLLHPEPSNSQDPHAVKILTLDGEMLGYIPRYYSADVSVRLSHHANYRCNIIKLHSDRNCEECIKVQLQMASLNMNNNNETALSKEAVL